MDRERHDTVERREWIEAAAHLIGDDAGLWNTLARTAAKAHKLYLNEQGCTLRLTGERVRVGYAVSSATPTFVTRSLRRNDVRTFLVRHYHLLAAEGMVLGTWMDAANGRGMVLATRVFATLEAADEAARRERQNFIGSLHERCSINAKNHADRVPWPNP